MTFLSRVIKKLFVVRSMFSQVREGADDFYTRLNKALITLFWMYAVYSINYWGLSQYYWYLFAGLVIAFSNLALKNGHMENESEFCVSDINNEPRFRLADKVRKREF